MEIHKFSVNSLHKRRYGSKIFFSDVRLHGTWNMTTSPNGNIFHVTSPFLCQSTGGFLSQSLRRGSLMFHLICAWTNGWANNWGTSDLKFRRSNYNVMVSTYSRVVRVAWERLPNQQQHDLYFCFGYKPIHYVHNWKTTRRLVGVIFLTISIKRVRFDMLDFIQWLMPWTQYQLAHYTE